MNKNNFKEIQNQHLALAQYHRWYQVYEIPFNDSRIRNQMDILSDDVEIVSQAGVTKGKDGLPDRLKVYEGWKNAHHVKNVQVTSEDDQTLRLEADILYQNIRPDDSRYSYTIHYSTLLTLRENDLPVFTYVNLQGTGVVTPPEFVSAYAENRARSFMHYWLYLMETAQADKFEELLAENFQLHMSTTGDIDTLAKFKEWVSTIPSRITASAHTPKNLTLKENEDGTINVSVDFDWQGIATDGSPMTAETHHEWVLENNPDERFARMKTMTVTQIRPFEKVQS